MLIFCTKLDLLMNNAIITLLLRNSKIMCSLEFFLDKIMAKILLIEDDEIISGMYKTKLVQDGYELVLASNGIDALEMVEVEKPDIILLDIIMPGLDGFSVLEDFRQNKKITVPIIMLTNLGTDEDKKKGEDLGATGYLIKSNLTPGQVSLEVKKYLQ